MKIYHFLWNVSSNTILSDWSFDLAKRPFTGRDAHEIVQHDNFTLIIDRLQSTRRYQYERFLHLSELGDHEKTAGFSREFGQLYSTCAWRCRCRGGHQYSGDHGSVGNFLQFQDWRLFESHMVNTVFKVIFTVGIF